MKPCTFQPKLEKIKKNPPRKKFLIFQEMELSNSKIKKFLIFSQKKTFPIFPKMETCTFWPQPSQFFSKKFLIFFLKKICPLRVSYIFSKKAYILEEV